MSLIEGDGVGDEERDKLKDRELMIKIKFRLTLIEKYISTLTEIKIRVLYDSGDENLENPLKEKFPYLSFFEEIETRSEIVYEEMPDYIKRPLVYKIFNFRLLVDKLLNVNYCDDLIPEGYSDTDTDTDTDTEDFYDKKIRKELYKQDLFDENIAEQVYIEAYNDIYDEF